MVAVLAGLDLATIKAAPDAGAPVRMQAVVDVHRAQCAATRQRGQGMEQGGGIGATAEGHAQRVLRRCGELGSQVLDERGGQRRRGDG